MIPRFLLIIVNVLFVGLFNLFGQGFEQDTIVPDTIALEEVTISVLPFEEQYKEATGGIFLLKQEEILQYKGISSSEIFNNAPGVFMSSGALNTHRVVIRGIGSRTPYNTNRIRAYLDDIPLTSGDGISTLEDQDQLALGSIEILKGPASALYGSGLGGIIRLNSPFPANDGLSFTLTDEGASFGTLKYGALGSYKGENLALTSGFTRSSTDGFRENSTYARNNAFLHALFFQEKHTIKLTLSLVDLYAEIPSSINEDDFLNNPNRAGGAWGSIEGYEKYNRMLGGLKVESRLGSRVKNHFILFTTYSDPYERRPFNILDEQSFNVGFREYLEYWANNLKLSGGVEYFHENFNWKIFETLPELQGDLLSDYSENRRYLNSFVLAQWNPSGKVLIDAGLNLNLLAYDLETNFRTDSTDQSGAYQYNPVISPRVGINVAHTKNIRTYLSVGHGFSAPSLEETLMPEGNINTSLKPETGWNFELGNRGILLKRRLNYDLTFYTVYLKNLLVTERLAEDVFTGTNAGKALNSGIEALLKAELYPEVKSPQWNSAITLSYTLSRNVFLDFIDDEVDYSGKKLPGIPQQELNTNLSTKWKGIEFRLNHRYTGDQWMTDANDMKYQGYSLINLHLGWNHAMEQVPYTVGLYGGIRNVLDTHYAGMILINAPSFGGPPRYYYPGSPRQFYFGVRLKFN